MQSCFNESSSFLMLKIVDAFSEIVVPQSRSRTAKKFIDYSGKFFINVRILLSSVLGVVPSKIGMN